MTKELKQGFVREIDGTLHELNPFKSKSTARRRIRRVWYKSAKIARRHDSFAFARFAIKRAYANK